jgi:predicted transcriptional regulator
MSSPPHLSRRERQIMDILHRRGRATVAEVMADLSGEPAYSTVRAQLRVLEEKGHIRHEEEQLRYVYLPAQSHRLASRSALKHLIDTFFQGSPEQVVEALLGKDGSGVSREELDRIVDVIERARRESKRPGRRSLGEGSR